MQDPKVTVRLDGEMIEKIDGEDATRSDVIRRALRGYFDRPQPGPEYYDEEEMLEELYTFAEELGRTPTRREVQENDELASEVTYRNHFGSHEEAVRRAGLYPSGHGPRSSEDRVREYLAVADMPDVAEVVEETGVGRGVVREVMLEEMRGGNATREVPVDV